MDTHKVVPYGFQLGLLLNRRWLGHRGWFGEINWEIWHHGQYRSMNIPYANMMLNQGDFSWERSVENR